MLELLEAAILPINIVFTILLVVVLLYWFSVIIGALDVSSMDIDLDKDLDIDFGADVDIDMDVDVDHDIDVDADHDVDGGGGSGWFVSALSFFNFGKVPFMVIMSFLILSMWSISIMANHYLGGGSALFALGALIPNLCISLIISKILTTPLVPIFKNLNTSSEAVDYIGKTCTLLLPATATSIGQAEVELNGAHLLINVKVEENDAPAILKGEQAVVVGQEEESNFYWVKKADSFVI